MIRQNYLHKTNLNEMVIGAVVVVWQLDLQLPMQSVPITTNMSLVPVHGKVYSIQDYVIKFVRDLRWSVVFCRYSGFLHQ